MPPAGLQIGMAVYDSAAQMPGTLTSFEGRLIRITRPTGFSWDAHPHRVRRATPWERRQLQAIARLHEQRQRAARASP
ncbi:hypothetical protein I5Q34_21940 [Streptomyces sp. AV19]|uniref:hypothetical protein n=1 Tax=Streptomyces sp. AV19 TaxID=2793068 RepID=UPI0018FE8C51|nr:hypothetical protein [Streptomyces sp. AV19]MBH1936897.1 hypothetical protein [Streptomyces sp. AV19]MDG4532938.1 hypothetical protein [Streptomyces sp. AV19]